MAPEPLTPAAVRFAPCAALARRLDARMRARLDQSLRHVLECSAGRLAVPGGLERLFARLGRGPVSPQAFGAYFDLVLAIEADDLAAAEARLAELAGLASPSPGLSVRVLEDPARHPPSGRYQRLIDTDPSARFELRPPAAEDASGCRERIAAALELIEAGHPELAAELSELLREVVLAVGPERDEALIFDGASTFMMWGGIVLNASSHETRLAMVQALAHESAHNLLFGFSADGQLVEDDDGERFPSPLRQDARPLDGVYHAAFVAARMHQAVATLLASGRLGEAEREEARGALAGNAEAWARGVEVVDRHARLTPIGAAALEAARAYMDGA